MFLFVVKDPCECFNFDFSSRASGAAQWLKLEDGLRFHIIDLTSWPQVEDFQRSGSLFYQKHKKRKKVIKREKDINLLDTV